MSQLQLTRLSKKVDICVKCPLHKSRKNAVAGDGKANAEIFFVGEAPGKEEDLEKRTFTGRSGKLLDLLLSEINLKRDDVYTTNVVKCRPPNNQPPLLFERSQCHPYLRKQLEIIQPKIIVALGVVAGKELFKEAKIPFSKISLIHGRIYPIALSYGKATLTAFYHPAAALRNPKILAILKSDFNKVFRIVH
jgi:uracil-DNA glycosylase